MSRESLSSIINKITNQEIVLPNFQRKFVWIDEDMQVRFISSVLAKMPVGSILMLQGSSDEFAIKPLGSKVNFKTDKKDVEYLLDGQQRITVLTNIFSNVILNTVESKDLVSKKGLQQRAFLTIPKIKDNTITDDIFGIKDFKFVYKNDEYPDFVSSDIREYIKLIGYNTKENVPYNPKFFDLFEIIKYATEGDENYYLLPLFLILDEKNSKHYNSVIDKIAYDRMLQIKTAYIDIIDEDEKYAKELIKNIIDDASFSYLEKNGFTLDLVETELKSSANDWGNKLRDYLNSCLSNIDLEIISIKRGQRERAIDIYENMNLGGVKLSTFDLVMARVAKIEKEKDFYQLLEDSMKMDNFNDVDLAPEPRIQMSPCEFGKCFSNNSDWPNAFKDNFLNVLSLICNFPNYNVESLTTDYIKRKEILKLSSEKIMDNYSKSCIGINRTMFFLQTRCGIRYIKDVNYSLMVTILSYILSNDNFYDGETLDVLEAWYWSAIFSGEFDKDQNARAINSIKEIISTLNNNDISFVKNLVDRMFKIDDFSSMNFLLLNGLKNNRMPKEVIKKTLCQFLLAKSYTGFFDTKVKISVYMDEYDTLQAHHIIPLGSVTKISESTTQLRNDNTHYLNSPFNYLYITGKENNMISDKSLEQYFTEINDTVKDQVCIVGGCDVINEDDQVQFLKNRAETMTSRIIGHVNSLISKI